MKTSEVRISKHALARLHLLPQSVQEAYLYWKREVELFGIEEVRKIPGYHDEPLKGRLKGLIRSVRLNRGFRVYYRVLISEVSYVLVEEVNKHDYKKIERLFGF